MSTVSHTITHGVTLGSAGYTSPLTITAGGYIKDGHGSSDAVDASYPAVVVNYGSIVGGKRLGTGVYLYAGGTVTNETGALIQGYIGVYSGIEAARARLSIPGLLSAVFSSTGVTGPATSPIQVQAH
jgi:hypothetical protein